jgi:basic membrane lipoprotein Med (substrate-binding protein (PBP1-ABC) superfamily)
VEVKVSVTGSWYDPEEEAKSAQALIDAGVRGYRSTL